MSKASDARFAARQQASRDEWARREALVPEELRRYRPGWSNLGFQQAVEILRRHRAGAPLHELVRAFALSPKQVQMILDGRSFRGAARRLAEMERA
jgi:hypothetical protein